MDLTLIKISFITIIILGIVALTSKGLDQKKEVETLIKQAGSTSKYLDDLGFARKNYEKIEHRSKYLSRLDLDDILEYYINKGYDVRWVKVGQYDGYYEAIKLKTN